ncbi:MAG: DNA-binding protein WhiA [Clostridia bacterium]
MSFSSDVKQELLKVDFDEANIYLSDAQSFGESLTTANFKSSLNDKFKLYMDISKLKESSIKAILKGIFLSSGCIVDPNIDNHFEVIIKNKACAEYILNLLSVLDFTPKLTKRNNSYIIYIKSTEQISTFLSIIEAFSSLLRYEEIRVEKEVKNLINRTTNCETANITKTILTSVNQLKAIDKLRDSGVYDTLNDKLKYTIMLREKYRDESLQYISNMTKDSEYISKSGLKHRLDKIIEIANNIE